MHDKHAHSLDMSALSVFTTTACVGFFCYAAGPAHTSSVHFGPVGPAALRLPFRSPAWCTPPFLQLLPGGWRRKQSGTVELSALHLLKPPGKDWNISSSDRFPLKPKGENSKIFISANGTSALHAESPSARRLAESRKSHLRTAEWRNCFEKSSQLAALRVAETVP